METTHTTIYFQWSAFMPDYRQYKPASPVINPQFVIIAIDVPLEAIYIYNFAEIMTKRNEEKDAEPILTPLGMRYCIDKFAEVMSDKEESSPEDFVNVDIEFEEDNTASINTTSTKDWTPEFDEGDAGKFDEEPFDNENINWEEG